MPKLNGKISDRIRSGELPNIDIKFKGNTNDDEPPSADAVRRASGYGMGSSAERRRSGDRP